MEYPDQSQTGDLVLIDQILSHGRYVLRSAGMVKRGRLGLRAAAIPLIHADTFMPQASPLAAIPSMYWIRSSLPGHGR